MRYCTRCRRITPGQPLYCNHCGASYDVKLCPRRHVNPREAEVCGVCGSRDLSRPAPALPFGLRVLAFFASWIPLLILFLFSLALFSRLLEVLLTDHVIQTRLLILVLLFSLLTFLYSKFPKPLQRLIHSSFRKAKVAFQNRKKNQ